MLRAMRTHTTQERKGKSFNQPVTSQPVQYRDSVSLRNGSGTHRPRQAGCKSQNQTKQRQKRGQMNKTRPPSSTSPCFYKLAENCRNKDCIDKPASQSGGLLQRPDAELVFLGYFRQFNAGFGTAEAGSLEVKLPTVRTNGKAEVRRIREEKESEDRRSIRAER